MYYIPYNANLKTFARELRNKSTLGEILLWQQVRAGAMMGYQFNRQKPLDKYIVDFYCKPVNLVIEVDGKYHTLDEQAVADDVRQKFLEEFELNFLRFTEMEVRKDVPMVLRTIESYILDYEEKFPEIKERKSRYKSPRR